MDSSTIITAKRELVEEMFLPEAEYTKYMQAALGDIIDFGEWNINKREECHFIDSFNALDFADWIVFRATDKNDKGEIVPMTVRRKSPRVMHLKTEVPNSKIVKNTETGEHEYITTWFTRFISDVYLFIAPEGYIDNNEQMEKLLKAAEENGAAEAHRLTTIEDLINDVETNPDNYTDDMVYICSEKKWLLIQFSESIKYIFNR